MSNGDQPKVSLELYNKLVPEEMTKIRQLVGDERFDSGKFDIAKNLLDELVSNDDFVDFLTLIAYEKLD